MSDQGQDARREMGVALGLGAIAGCVDSLGYLTLHGFFLSFMSGNTTQLGIGLAGWHLHDMAVAGGLIGLFVAGVVLGRLIGRPRAVLAVVAMLLGLAALLATPGQTRASIVLAALALGAANDVVQKAGTVSVSATYTTGTLVKMGQGLGAMLRGGPAWGWAPYAMLWAALLSGAVIGAALYPVWGLRGLWVPAVATALLVPVRIGR